MTIVNFSLSIIPATNAFNQSFRRLPTTNYQLPGTNKISWASVCALVIFFFFNLKDKILIICNDQSFYSAGNYLACRAGNQVKFVHFSHSLISAQTLLECLLCRLGTTFFNFLFIIKKWMYFDLLSPAVLKHIIFFKKKKRKQH